MFITYRRTGGMFAFVALTAVVLATTMLTVAVAAGVLIVAVAIAAIRPFARAVLRTTSSHDPAPVVTPWPQATIEATVVNPKRSSLGTAIAETDAPRVAIREIVKEAPPVSDPNAHLIDAL